MAETLPRSWYFLDTSTRPVAWACLLIGLTFLAYLPALDAGFVFDDTAYLTQDDRMESAAGLGRIWTEVAGGGDYKHQYYPMTSSVLWLQHRLWSDTAIGYHLVNVLLHAANAILLWRVLRRLGVPGAFVAGAIFAVHPVHVQSVAWISELKNVLSGFFFLSSALVFVRHFHGDEAAAPWRRRVTYTTGLLLFLCALLSKTATCLLPAMLALVLWWKRDRLSKRDLLALAPMFILGIGFVSMTVYLESHYGGAHGDVYAQSWLERILIAGRALWFYAAKLAWPVGIVFIYPRWSVSTHLWWQYLFPLAVVGITFALWRWRHRIGKGPVAAVAYFILAIAPLALVNVAFTRLSYVSNHWVYWASMGFIALAVAAGFRAGAALAPRLRTANLRAAGAVGFVAVVAVLAGLSWNRCLVYENEEILWRDTVTRNPEAWVAHYNLGLVLSAAGRTEEAIAHFQRGIVIEPDNPLTHNNLGIELRALGRLDEAVYHFNEALWLAPGFVKAHVNLGTALLDLDRDADALDHFRVALLLDPQFAGAHFNLGVALGSQGLTDAAVAHIREAVRIDPRFVEARVKLGEELCAQGQVDEAIDHLNEALRIAPGLLAAHYQLGIALEARGERMEAIERYRGALELAPDNARIHDRLAWALTATGQQEMGLIHEQTALHFETVNETGGR